MQYSLSSPTPKRSKYSQNYTPKRSKLDLSKSAILDILIVAQTQFPNCTFSVISWNSSTKILNGNFIEMQKHVSELYADGGTDFEKMFNCIKTFGKGPLDKFILLTDGHDSNGIEKIEELKKDITLTQLFDGIIGVGSETDVDHVFLNHLSLNNPSVYTLTSDEKEISELVHSLCFSALNTIFAENITLRILCKKTDLYIPNGENMSITYKNTCEIKDLPESSLFTFQTSDNGIVLISPTEQKKSSEHRQHIVFALDTSGSMADETQKNSSKENSKEDTESTEYNFVECVIRMKMMSPEYKMLFYANAIDVNVEYTYQGVLHHERIKKEVAPVSDEKIFYLAHRMLYISKKLSKKQTKEELKSLYMDHLNMENEMKNEMENDKIPGWLIHQVKKVLESLRNRYLSTLTKGERFFEDSASSPSLLALCRTASAGASQVYESSYVDTDIEKYKTKCKICFVNEADMVMLPCKHIGTCKECIKTLINTKSICNCPFCRQEISDYISLKSVMLCSCKNVATHIGTCGHSLFCKQKKCRDDFSSNFSTCITCQKKVDTIKVYMC